MLNRYGIGVILLIIIVFLFFVSILYLPKVLKKENPTTVVPTPVISLYPTTSENKPTEEPEMCAQVITSARNSKTGECKDFPTPCDVPEGWEKVASCNPNDILLLDR